VPFRPRSEEKQEEPAESETERSPLEVTAIRKLNLKVLCWGLRFCNGRCVVQSTGFQVARRRGRAKTKITARR
jgi:hypothetical protein